MVKSPLREIESIAAAVQRAIDDLYAQASVIDLDSPLAQAGLKNGLGIVQDYLAHNERGLALEQLLYMIAEAGVPVRQGDWNRLDRLARPMGLANHVRRAKEIPCPACGCMTLESNYGSYDICRLCGWEDDGVQLANPACEGGANGESLIAAQARAKSEGIPTLAEANGVRRDPRWRPLTAVEQRLAEEERVEKYWKHRAIVWLQDCYWMGGLPYER
jgi:hypothetical protein